VEPYSFTRMPRTSGTSRLARQLTTSYNPAPIASTIPTPYEDTASTYPSEEADLALEVYYDPNKMAFAAGLLELTVYPQTLRVPPSVHLTVLISGKLFALSLITVKIKRFGLLSRNPMYRKEGR
jgi:hypothetical protein